MSLKIIRLRKNPSKKRCKKAKGIKNSFIRLRKALLERFKNCNFFILMKSKNLKSKKRIKVALLILLALALAGILGGIFLENCELSFGAYQFGVDVDGNNSELRNVQVYYNFQKEEGHIEFFAKNAEAIGVDYPPSLNITSIEPKWIKTEVRLGKEPYPSTLIIRGPIYQSSFKINF